MLRCYEVAHIVGISKTGYVPATPRCLEWRHDLPRTSTNNDPPDSEDPARESAHRHHGDRRSPRLPVAGVLALCGRTTRRPGAWRNALEHGVAGIWPGRVRPHRTVA